jgi:hypothetical protein
MPIAGGARDVMVGCKQSTADTAPIGGDTIIATTSSGEWTLVSVSSMTGRRNADSSATGTVFVDSTSDDGVKSPVTPTRELV